MSMLDDIGWDHLNKRSWRPNKSDHISYFQEDIIDWLIRKEYNEKNYYQNTAALYVWCPPPSHEPNFISDSGSQYRYSDVGVYRASDHRGRVGNNLWYLDIGDRVVPDTIDHQAYLDRIECWFCAWEHFLLWPNKGIIRPLPDYLISKKIFLKNGKIYVDRYFDDIDYLPNWRFKNSKFYDMIDRHGQYIVDSEDAKSQFLDFNKNAEQHIYPIYLEIKEKLLNRNDKY